MPETTQNLAQLEARVKQGLLDWMAENGLEAGSTTYDEMFEEGISDLVYAATAGVSLEERLLMIAAELPDARPNWERHDYYAMDISGFSCALVEDHLQEFLKREFDREMSSMAVQL